MSETISHRVELTEVRIWPTRSTEISRVRARVSLTLNGTRVRGCRIIEGDAGLFLAYTTAERLALEEWKSRHPAAPDPSSEVQEAIIKRYNEMVAWTEGN